MNPVLKSVITFAVFTTALPAHAASSNVWVAQSGPAYPFQYAEMPPISRLTPQIANAETYASKALFQRLYPSINSGDVPEVATISASMLSKTREFSPVLTRGNLSPSYVQEFAYIDAYSNSREYEEFFTYPSIRMNLAMPQFGSGLGGGYQPLQFGFGPAAFKVW